MNLEPFGIEAEIFIQKYETELPVKKLRSDNKRSTECSDSGQSFNEILNNITVQIKFCLESIE